MQLCIAIIILVGLLGLTFWPSTNEKTRKNHMLNLSTVLVEFHKVQCYFISAIEIAALVLDRQAYNDFKRDLPPPVFDILLSFPLSMNGFVPVMFTLSCISLYARLSWHIIILSLVTVCLSTGALSAAYIWILRITDAFGPDALSVDNAGIDYQEAPEMAQIVCGSKPGNLRIFIDRTDFRFALVWLIYTYCIAWGLWCVFRHTLNRPPRGSLRERTLTVIKGLAHAPPLSKIPKKFIVGVGYPALLLIWALCFVYHFYLYSLFTKSGLVSPSWTFGQIIAVTVWAPFIVEYLYIEQGEFSRSKLGPKTYNANGST